MQNSLQPINSQINQKAHTTAGLGQGPGGTLKGLNVATSATFQLSHGETESYKLWQEEHSRAGAIYQVLRKYFNSFSSGILVLVHTW